MLDPCNVKRCCKKTACAAHRRLWTNGVTRWCHNGGNTRPSISALCQTIATSLYNQRTGITNVNNNSQHQQQNTTITTTTSDNNKHHYVAGFHALAKLFAET